MDVILPYAAALNLMLSAIYMHGSGSHQAISIFETVSTDEIQKLVVLPR